MGDRRPQGPRRHRHARHLEGVRLHEQGGRHRRPGRSRAAPVRPTSAASRSGSAITRSAPSQPSPSATPDRRQSHSRRCPSRRCLSRRCHSRLHGTGGTGPGLDGGQHLVELHGRSTLAPPPPKLGRRQGGDARGTTRMLSAADLSSIDIHTLDLYATRGYPWAEWDLLRREAPVYWYDRPGIEPFWAITRYDDVHAVGRDAATFVNSGRRLRLHSIEHEDAMWASKARRDGSTAGTPTSRSTWCSWTRPATPPSACSRPGPSPRPGAGMAGSLAGPATRFVDELETALDAPPANRSTWCGSCRSSFRWPPSATSWGCPSTTSTTSGAGPTRCSTPTSTEWALPGENRRDMRRRLRVEYFDYYEQLIAAKRAQPGRRRDQPPRQRRGRWSSD